MDDTEQVIEDFRYRVHYVDANGEVHETARAEMLETALTLARGTAMLAKVGSLPVFVIDQEDPKRGNLFIN